MGRIVPEAKYVFVNDHISKVNLDLYSRVRDRRVEPLICNLFRSIGARSQLSILEPLKKLKITIVPSKMISFFGFMEYPSINLKDCLKRSQYNTRTIPEK
jgi:hypothetical protein